MRRRRRTTLKTIVSTPSKVVDCSWPNRLGDLNPTHWKWDTGKSWSQRVKLVLQHGSQMNYHHSGGNNPKCWTLTLWKRLSLSTNHRSLIKPSRSLKRQAKEVYRSLGLTKQGSLSGWERLDARWIRRYTRTHVRISCAISGPTYRKLILINWSRLRRAWISTKPSSG